MKKLKEYQFERINTMMLRVMSKYGTILLLHFSDYEESSKMEFVLRSLGFERIDYKYPKDS
jgi:hypothetical protein